MADTPPPSIGLSKGVPNRGVLPQYSLAVSRQAAGVETRITPVLEESSIGSQPRVIDGFGLVPVVSLPAPTPVETAHRSTPNRQDFT